LPGEGRRPRPGTLGVGGPPEDVPDALLTPGHIIKTNNASGQNYLPHRKPLTRPAFEKQFRRWLRASAGKRLLGWLDQGQEWAYRPVRTRMFVERQVGAGRRLIDLSMRVLGGEVFLGSCALDFKTEDVTFGYFWPDGTPVADAGAPNLPEGFTVPPVFHEAVRAAERLGQGVDYLRIDFLTDGQTLFAGEITCYPASGYGPNAWYTQLMYRRWLETLPLSWPLSTPQTWHRRPYIAAFRRWLDIRRAELARESLPAVPKL